MSLLSSAMAWGSRPQKKELTFKERMQSYVGKKFKRGNETIELLSYDGGFFKVQVARGGVSYKTSKEWSDIYANYEELK